MEERRSSVPAYLEALGVLVEIAVLPTGDYVVGDAAVVERKTVADFHRSIANTRLWSQVADLARAPERGYLLLEGVDLDAGPLTREGVRGAVLQVIDNGIAVVRSSGAADSAVWLRLLAVRGNRSGAVRGRRGRRRSVATPLGLLSTVPGISPTLAQRLVARFGSVAGVAAASVSDLLEIEGIGPVRGEAIRRALLGTFPRNGEVP